MAKQNRKRQSAIANDMISTLLEDAEAVGKALPNLRPFTEAVVSFLSGHGNGKRMPAGEREQLDAGGRDSGDVAGGARLAFGGLMEHLSKLAAEAKPKAKRKRKLGPARD